MSLRILIAHALPGQRGEAHALYIGSSGAELEAAKSTAAAHIGSFSIINNAPAIRKSNPRYDPTAKAPPPGAAAETVQLAIPDEIKSLSKKELATHLANAIQYIQRIEEENRRLQERMLVEVQEGTESGILPPQETDLSSAPMQNLQSNTLELLETASPGGSDTTPAS